ncbi:hypothetical protein QAD02_011010 [Eretmocerus hayati]|uniref:Uncharacterized protein n=1 Tax=Eretmocerus hayati TaxID=131215 RepID=A0ACC2NVV4_9HYME|nr:hypothetical protein QAD02_011010 [Eretmocerus hayati]
MSPIVFLVFLASAFVVTQAIDYSHLKCLVCRGMVDEFTGLVEKIDSKKKMSIGQYQLDPKGNTAQKTVHLRKSEVYLSEQLENLCKKMEDYVRATYKSNGQLTLLKLMTDKGLNPLMSEVDIIQDGDLNKSVEYHCAEIVNEYEETFINVFREERKDPEDEICLKETGYCEGIIEEVPQGYDESEDTSDDDDSDKLDEKSEL